MSLLQVNGTLLLFSFLSIHFRNFILADRISSQIEIFKKINRRILDLFNDEFHFFKNDLKEQWNGVFVHVICTAGRISFANDRLILTTYTATNSSPEDR